MIKAILFDLDGTIINTNELILTSFDYVLNKKYGLKVSKKEIVKTFGEPLKASLDFYLKDKSKEGYQLYMEFSHKMQDTYIQGYEHVEEGLKALLSSGYKLAIVTSKRRERALSGLNAFNLTKYFKVIVTPEDTLKHKPNGEPVLKACELLEIQPDEAIMVGDSHNDILSGKNAGAKTCLVSYTALELQEVLKSEPDFVVDTIEEIVDIIENDKLKNA